MSTDKLRNRIGNLPTLAFKPGVSDSTGDNIAIALASYFEGHDERPKDDPPSEVSESWGTWSLEKTDDALDRIVAEIGGWRPIETAPRGETVLLWVSNAFGHSHVKTGIAHPTNHPDLKIVSIFDDGEALGYKPEAHATHWMPLPERP